MRKCQDGWKFGGILIKAIDKQKYLCYKTNKNTIVIGDLGGMMKGNKMCMCQMMQRSVCTVLCSMP